MTKPCNPGEKILLRSPGKTKRNEWMRGEGTHTEKQKKSKIMQDLKRQACAWLACRHQQMHRNKNTVLESGSGIRSKQAKQKSLPRKVIAFKSIMKQWATIKNGEECFGLFTFPSNGEWEGVVEKMGKKTSETGTGESLYILIVRPCRKQRSPKQDMLSNDNSDSKHSSHI